MISTARTHAGLELVGNALCLDFANTVNSRRDTVHDYLGSYADLLAWSEHAGALDAGRIVRVLPRATGPAAAAVLARAHRLRDAVYGTFSAFAGGRRPASADVDVVGAAYAAAMRHARFELRTNPAGASGSAGDRPVFDLGWSTPAPEQLDAPLWRVAHSAGELLLTGDLTRVGECPSCGWLFLDTSRNANRRWCSMATCGSRDKMSRYRRHRGASS